MLKRLRCASSGRTCCASNSSAARLTLRCVAVARAGVGRRFVCNAAFSKCVRLRGGRFAARLNSSKETSPGSSSKCARGPFSCPRKRRVPSKENVFSQGRSFRFMVRAHGSVSGHTRRRWSVRAMGGGFRFRVRRIGRMRKSSPCSYDFSSGRRSEPSRV